MNCPVDGTPLLMTERQGIEIDYCPHCRGIWLDRGELDKLLQRPAQIQSGAAPYQASSQSAGMGDSLPPMKRRLRREDNGYAGDEYPEKRKNTTSADDDNKQNNNPLNRVGDFLGDIFDIF